MTRSLARLACALLAVLALFPAAANAAQINGDPLLISSADESGSLGVAFATTRTPEFFGSSVDPETGLVSPGNAGFNVILLEEEGGATVFPGRRSSGAEVVQPTAVTGSGTPADPFRLTGAWAHNPGTGRVFELRQRLTYVNGRPDFVARYEVVNVSGQPINFRASMGADLLGGGSDLGVGLFDAGPPRFVAGFNTSVGSVAGLAEITPWDGFEEGQYSDVLGRADADPRAGGESLLDRVEPTLVDNGAAVQWDGYTSTALPPGGTAAFEVAWRFTRTFALTPGAATATTGDTAPFVVTIADQQGRPRAGQLIRWSSTGATTASGTAETGQDGRARIDYIGANPGTDVVSVYADFNRNGQRDEDEPARDATIEWSGPPAPRFARQVNLKPVSGRVLVRTPRRGRNGKVIPAGRSRFVRLTRATQFRMGSEIDTSRGRVQMTSARGPRGGVQSLQAYQGRFVVSQPRRGRGMTEMRLTGRLRCATGRGNDLVSSARRARRLWARGRGRFRTRGRRSAATVRGTTWLTKDTCRTTTTVVRDGVVVVRDFARGKNVRVRAGKRYVARGRRR